MAITAEEVIVDVIARTNKLDGAMNASRVGFDRNASAIERSANRMSAAIVRSSNQAGQATAAAAQRSRLLGFQIADIGAQLASGSSPFVVLAQQAPQVANALDGTKGAVGRLATILSGPLGAAGLAAASILAVIISRLAEASSESAELKKRLSEAADGADAFGDAQSILGRLVDLTTGKLKIQNDVLRATIRLQALLARQQAATEKAGATKKINRVTDDANRLTGGMSLSAMGDVGGPAEPLSTAAPELRALSSDVLNGKIGIDNAIKRLQDLQRSGKAAKDTVADLQSQFVEFGQAQQKDEASRAILDYLDGKGLDPRLRTSGGSKARGRKDKDTGRSAAEVDAQFERLLANLQTEQLRLREGLTTDLRERANLEREQVALAREQALAEVTGEKDLSQARRQQLNALVERNAEIRNTQINWKLDDDLAAEELAIDRARLESSTTALQGDLEAARTQAERRQLQLAILDAEGELQRIALEAVIAAKESTEAQKQIARARLAQLPAEQERQRDFIVRNTNGPLGQYLDGLPRDAAEMNEAYERVAVDGLQELNDGLTDAIMNSKSLADVFSNIADQIIADLLRIAIQQAVIKPLAEGLGAGGVVSGIGKLLGFASGGYTGDLPANRVAGVVHGGEFVMNANATRRIGVGNLEALARGIEPIAATRVAAPAGTIVKNFNINVSADHSVTPAGFARGLASEILEEARRMDAKTANETLREVPAALAYHQRYRA